MFFSLENKNHKEAEYRKNSTAAIKKWVKEKLNIDEDAVIVVTELNCSDPACPGKETVVGIIQKSNHQKFSIHKPLLYIRKWDIDALFKQ
jgi:hypothetical protein